jgi:hypothetical protein
MASAPKVTPVEFEQTCWRGLQLSHPADWEAGFLSGLGKPRRCVFVDRRFQRLEVQWRRVPRQPDLRQMYQRVGKSYRDHPSSPLAGVPDWEGIVRREDKGSVVHAGRYFDASRWLVQVVLTWPGRRDRRVERAVLASIAPQEASEAVRWRALGLSAALPSAYELTTCNTQVGRVSWEFRRSGRRPVGLILERIAMGRYWLKEPLGDWLRTQLPAGFKVRREVPAGWAGHRGAAARSRRSNLLRGLLGLGVNRVDLAWSCPSAQRVYRLGVWQRTAGEIDWPAPLSVNCCRDLELRADDA